MEEDGERVNKLFANATQVGIKIKDKRMRSTSSNSRMAVFLGLWTIMLLTALQGELAEAKSELQIVKYKYPQLYPERFAWDGKHKRFILGSTVLGKLVTVTEAGVVEDFVFDEDFDGKSEIHGVFVDTTRNRVLAVVEAGRGDFDPPVAHLVAYDLDSKNRILMVPLNEEGHGSKDSFFFKDVCADKLGNAYVTETVGNSIWKVALSGEKSLFAVIPQLVVIVKEPGFAEAGVNGIVYADGFILVSQFNSGALFRVKVYDKKVDQVKIAEGRFLMSEADGMAVRQDGTLVLVSAHTAWLLSSRDSWRSASLVDKLALETSTFTTSVATRDMQIFVLASYLDENLVDLDRENFQIEEIEFPADTANSPWYLLAILGMFGFLVLIWKFQMTQFNRNYTKKRL